MRRLVGLATGLMLLTLTGCAALTALGTQAGQVDVSANDAQETTYGEDAEEASSETAEERPAKESEAETEPVPVQEISFESTRVHAVKGEEFTLDLSVLPEEANTPKKVIWVTSDPKVVQADDTGNLKAVGGGTALVIAFMGRQTAVCQVTVDVPLEEIVLRDLELEYNSQTTYALDMELLPGDTTEQEAPVYESDDTAVLAVDPMGGLHTVGTGTANITVTVGDLKTECRVRVVSHLKALEFEQKDVSLELGGSQKLSVLLSPSNVTDEPTLKFSSSDPQIVSVDQNGVIKALSAGTSRITVSAGNISAECTVSVKIPLVGISLGQGVVQLEKGGSLQLQTQLLPADTTESPRVSYSSSNTSVAVVDESGVVSAVGTGNAVISASAGGYTSSCTVAVTASLQSIFLNKTDITMRSGESAALSVGYFPADTTDDRTVLWSSSSPEVASVDGGQVTAVSAGTCTVTATVGGQSASCIVRVSSYQETSSDALNEETSMGELPQTQKVIVLDAGHGGSDPGAGYNGLVEKDMNLKVALYCKAYLEEHYTGMVVLLTRSSDTQLAKDETGTDLRARCEYAASVGADMMVSLHFNSSPAHTSRGALALISKQSHVTGASASLANSILAQLSALGLQNRGAAIMESAALPGQDYYAINRICASYGIPGIIVEHCFMDQGADAAFCDSDEDLQRLAIADAIGIASYLGLAAK